MDNETDQRAVWLITGAAGALGSALVRRLSGTAECIALDRDEPGLNALHDELCRNGQSPPALMPLDLARAGPDDHARLAESIDEAFGRVDVLVHNAASFRALRPLLNQPPGEWMDSLQTGLTGPFLLTAALLPLMARASAPVIVFVNHHHCMEHPGNWGAYGIAQAGRRHMQRVLSEEAGRRGPRVIEVDPGAFFSRLYTSAWPATSPRDIASAADAAERVLDAILKQLGSAERA